MIGSSNTASEYQETGAVPVYQAIQTNPEAAIQPEQSDTSDIVNSDKNSSFTFPITQFYHMDLKQPSINGLSFIQVLKRKAGTVFAVIGHDKGLGIAEGAGVAVLCSA